MYDFASFAPGNSAAMSWDAVRFASSAADAYFTALPAGKSPNELAREWRQSGNAKMNVEDRSP